MNTPFLLLPFMVTTGVITAHCGEAKMKAGPLLKKTVAFDSVCATAVLARRRHVASHAHNCIAESRAEVTEARHSICAAHPRPVTASALKAAACELGTSVTQHLAVAIAFVSTHTRKPHTHVAALPKFRPFFPVRPPHKSPQVALTSSPNWLLSDT